MNYFRSALWLAILLALPGQAFERTEAREDCDHHTATRIPLFGDLYRRVHEHFQEFTFLDKPPCHLPL